MLVSVQQRISTRGTNQGSSRRLCLIAQPLGNDAGYFFDEIVSLVPWPSPIRGAELRVMALESPAAPSGART
jgi:hypothetical protein